MIGVANWGVELEALVAAVRVPPRRHAHPAHRRARVGRFGWKAPIATLWQFSTEPFNIELGVSTPFFPRENHAVRWAAAGGSAGCRTSRTTP